MSWHLTTVVWVVMSSQPMPPQRFSSFLGVPMSRLHLQICLWASRYFPEIFWVLWWKSIDHHGLTSQECSTRIYWWGNWIVNAFYNRNHESLYLQTNQVRVFSGILKYFLPYTLIVSPSWARDEESWRIYVCCLFKSSKGFERALIKGGPLSSLPL